MKGQQTLIIEATYGDKCHQHRRQRTATLRNVIEKAVSDLGVVLIPAFSIGRTQELLYELETIIHQQKHNPLWQQMDIILDSPLAAEFTQSYLEFQQLWDNEAKARVRHHRHPLDFSQLTTIGSHQQHLRVVNFLASRQRPAIVIAAGGMCAGGRIVNYLKRFLADPKADVILVGYQAKGTPGRDIQTYGPDGGYVWLDDNKVDIRAGIHTISGYSAHADQQNLLSFIKGIRVTPKEIIIVHGDDEAKQALAALIKPIAPSAVVRIATN